MVMKNTIEKFIYSNFMGTYDLVCKVVSKGTWQKWQRYVIRYFNGMSVLDMACGTGNLLVAGQEAGSFVVGIDNSEYMLRSYTKKIRDRPLRQNVAMADVNLLPFLSESFDIVVITFPVDYIFISEALSEAHRVLKVGGRLIILDELNLIRSWDRFFFNVLLNYLGDRSFKDIINALELRKFRTKVSEISNGISKVKLFIANK